jgi:hypothetical protein
LKLEKFYQMIGAEEALRTPIIYGDRKRFMLPLFDSNPLYFTNYLTSVSFLFFQITTARTSYANDIPMRILSKLANCVPPSLFIISSWASCET